METLKSYYNNLILSKIIYKREPLEKRISASQIDLEPLQVWLSYKHGALPETKIGQHTIGSILHLGMEKIFDLNNIHTIESEVPFEKEYRGWKLTATIDHIDHKNKIIADFKNVKRYTFEKNDPNSSYAWQLRFGKYLSELNYDLYNFMFIKNNEEDYRYKKEEIDVFQIVKIHDVSENVLLEKIDKLIDILEEGIKTDGKSIQKCKDVWIRKSISGKALPMKCVKYCSYNSVCPYYNPHPDSIISNW